MPRITIRLSESALIDLENIRIWYADQDVPHIGIRFLTEILERIGRLRDHPQMGRIVPEFGQPTLRELIHPPFRIVYRKEKSWLQIIRVWRGERMLRLEAEDPE